MHEHDRLAVGIAEFGTIDLVELRDLQSMGSKGFDRREKPIGRIVHGLSWLGDCCFNSMHALGSIVKESAWLRSPDGVDYFETPGARRRCYLAHKDDHQETNRDADEGRRHRRQAASGIAERLPRRHSVKENHDDVGGSGGKATYDSGKRPDSSRAFPPDAEQQRREKPRRGERGRRCRQRKKVAVGSRRVPADNAGDRYQKDPRSDQPPSRRSASVEQPGEEIVTDRAGNCEQKCGRRGKDCGQRSRPQQERRTAGDRFATDGKLRTTVAASIEPAGASSVASRANAA